MPGSCGLCSTVISRSNTGIQCQGRCGKEYHFKCVKLPTVLGETPSDSGIVWMCKACRVKPTDSNSLLEDLVEKVDALVNDMAQFRRGQTDFGDSLTFYGNKIDDFNKKMEIITKVSKTVDALNHELSGVKKECSSLRAEIEFMHQQGRSNNIEICGVPEKNRENVLSLVKKVGSEIGITILEEDIIVSHRVSQFSESQVPRRAPKNIIVKFANICKRNNFLEAAKKRRNPGLSSSNLGFEENVRIFVNEHLSPFYKLLFRKAREFCKNNNYKYCWVKGMKIFVKKNDEEKAVHIVNETVLSTLHN